MNSNLSAIREEGFRVLVKGLGTAGAVNFLRQFENGSGNYTEERRVALADVTIDDIAENIRIRKDSKSEKLRKP
ncbi:MAG: hypothetical protein LBT08_04555 [Synergistaceae bacterium]|jgi:hypothetical protein|nr:hypothetical protein [Synergistaceae bacterium]